MKFTWEASDIYANRKYSRKGIQEVWMIGYYPGSKDQFSSISLTDGMITPLKSKEEMAKELTSEKYVPLEYLPPKKQN
jgi:hypothetical protein